MKTNKYVRIMLVILVSFVLFNIDCYAQDNIVLNNPETNDVNHTFKYPNLEISDSVKPYSITLSIENGYFNTKNEELNELVETYFDFKGGTNTSNLFISDLDPEEDFKVITFNLKSSVDLNNDTTRISVVGSIKSFLRDILFYNEENKDAKFNLTFSETELKLTDELLSLEGLDVVAFKDPEQPKTHYYMKVEQSTTWTNAYDIAASLKWNNLQGYLATITSEAEHNFIYNSLGSIEGWIGAASITDADKVNYNTTGISWNTAVNKISTGTPFGYDLSNDNNIKTYWHWVAGPEAGLKVYDGYNNFSDGEPNNSTYEWCAEYGYGEDGKWNDYTSGNTSIEGYYIEFGGFENDSESIKPVSLVSTFKWTDYDFRNIENNLDEKINLIEYNENTTEEEIKKVVDEAIEKTGIEEATSKVINKKIVGDILSFDIEITIGNESNKATYTIHVDKKIDVEIPVSPKEEKEPIPQTGDGIVGYVIISVLALTGISLCFVINNKKVKC